MATINLLPWREERREELKKEYLTILGAFVSVAVLMVFLIQMALSSSLENQDGRNQFLQKRIDELDEQVKEIESLKTNKNQLVERMKIIQGLQGNRPEIVHIFDEIVRTLPDGVYYSSISRKGEELEIEGVAESNNRISSLMRQLDSSEWFASPNLYEVKAMDGAGSGASEFKLKVKVVSPSDTDAEQ
ncbi:Uncharacterised protein [BD1-7 clade bacterium]|uniref:Pilus assembly protein PilN n=1 Tax=BD1-7 clade bacterium TaxID=2029982 RepID=A0A5S9N6M5_9GAMM|nr:Uncharacterised protein [BD1-7 clade bacterium]